MAYWQVLASGLAALALASCTSGPGEGRKRQSSPPPTAAEAAAADQGAAEAARLAASPDAGPPLSEAAARVLLAQRFRVAGFRVRQDVRIRGQGFDLTADGFDPAKKVGFEYIAAEERGTDLLAEERSALARDPALDLLVVQAADSAQLTRAADSFLAKHQQPTPP